MHGIGNAGGLPGSGCTALLRKTPDRTVSALQAGIGALLESFEPDQYANSFHHAGHGSA